MMVIIVVSKNLKSFALNLRMRPALVCPSEKKNEAVFVIYIRVAYGIIKNLQLWVKGVSYPLFVAKLS